MVGELLGLLPLVVGQGQVKITGKRAARIHAPEVHRALNAD